MTLKHVVAGLAVFGCLSGAALAQTPPKPPSELEKASSGFWSNWKGYTATEQFKTLERTVGNHQKVAAAAERIRKTGTQPVLDISVNKPADAARLMTDAAGAGSGTNRAALATVMNMRTSEKTREAAAPLVAPQARAQVQQFRANLSNGIQGLPGIYLSDQPITLRAAAPAGYAPVRGASLACGGK